MATPESGGNIENEHDSYSTLAADYTAADDAGNYPATTTTTTWQLYYSPEGYPYYYDPVSGTTQWAPVDVDVDVTSSSSSSSFSSCSSSSSVEDAATTTLVSELYNEPEEPEARASRLQLVKTANEVKGLGEVGFEQRKDSTTIKWARKQVEKKNYQVSSNSVEYNIWYGKYMDHEKEDRSTCKASTRCHLALDAGITKGNFFRTKAYLCLFFARGHCHMGQNCMYLHRAPVEEDEINNDMMHDCFGRVRHKTDREDMDGVGTFSRECRTIWVTGMKVPVGYGNFREMQKVKQRIANAASNRLATGGEGADGLKATDRYDLEEVMARHFGEWGPITEISLKHKHQCAFVRYKWRSAAEFAKQAMNGQECDRDEVLVTRWAHEDPNPQVMARIQEENEMRVVAAVERANQHQKQHVGLGAVGGGEGETGRLSAALQQAGYLSIEQAAAAAGRGGGGGGGVAAPLTREEAEAEQQRAAVALQQHELDSVLDMIDNALHGSNDNSEEKMETNSREKKQSNTCSEEGRATKKAKR